MIRLKFSAGSSRITKKSSLMPRGRAPNCPAIATALDQAHTHLQGQEDKCVPFEYASLEAESLTIEAAAYDAGLPELRETLAQICIRVQELIPGPLREAVFGHLVRSAIAAAKCPPRRVRCIHLVGETGHGKSSLINCTAGIPGLAPAYSLGESVTRFATSYEAAFELQKRPFAARIVFLSANEVRAKLQALYTDYRSFHLDQADPAETSHVAAATETAGADDFLDGEEAFHAQNTRRQASQSAFEVFCDLFRKHKEEEFGNTERATTFLASAAKEPEERIIDDFAKCCEALLPRGTELAASKKNTKPGDRYRVSLIEAETLDDLHEHLKQYYYDCTSKEDQKEASLWPLVVRIHIGVCNAPILSHATLVDWPGTGDTNDLRAKASTQRVSDCDEIWIVNNISRVCTNRSVFDALHRYAPTKPCSIVCTHIDTNTDDPDDLRQLRQSGYRNVKYTAQLERRKALGTDVQDLGEAISDRKKAYRAGHILEDGRKLKATPKQLRTARKQNDRAELELSKLEKEIDSVDASIFNSAWDMRRSHYQNKLESTLRQRKLSAGIFFVSNEHYMAGKGQKPVKGSLLTLDRTGIPDLRRHVLRTTAADGMAADQEYLAAVEAFLLGVKMVANPDYLERNRGVLLDIAKAKGGVSNRKHGTYWAALDAAVGRRLQGPVDRNLKTFIAKAKVVVQDKSDWHASTLRAFIANAGFHETKKVRRQNWNRAFFAEFVTKLLSNWDTFAREEAEAFIDLRDQLLRDVAEVVLKLESTPQGADANEVAASELLADKKDEFHAFIDAKTRTVQRLCDKARREYALKLESNKTEATKPGNNIQKSFIDKAMDDGYDMCKLVTGRGYRNKVISELESHLSHTSSHSPFRSVAWELRKSIEEDPEAQIEPLVEAVEAIFDDITCWVEMVFAEQAGDSDALATRKVLQEYLTDASKTHEDIRAELENIAKKYENVG